MQDDLPPVQRGRAAWLGPEMAARRGADSALVWSSSLCNEMRQRRPDLARLLLQPIATDLPALQSAGRHPP